MSIVAENWSLLFYAEGDDALEYIDILDDEDEEAVIDQIVGGKLDDELEPDDVPEPDDEDEVFENDEGYVLIFSRRHERLWVYELMDYESDI